MKKPATHPNKIPFEGLLTLLDIPSDAPPSGARNHRVILTRDAALEALPSLIGMAVGFKAGWDGHDARQKCGVITEAWIEGSGLLVRGHLFGHDFPEIERKMGKPDADLGMSYELADAHIENMRAQVWTVTKCIFTGAAILQRTKAAYRTTRVNLSAVADNVVTKLTFVGESSRIRLAKRGKRCAR